MKINRILLTFIGLCAMFITLAQVPEKIDFQAMARDAIGNPYINQSIGVQISIKQSSSTGTIVYQEQHSTTTNSYGLFVLSIGEGTPVSGTFASIDWTIGSYYAQVEVDPNGGTDYTDMGTMEMMSVPFALFADRAGYGEDDDADPNNEFQTISESGNVITLSNGGGTVTDDTEDDDADPVNEIQTISESGNLITLSDGGGTVTDDVDDADADPINEVQTISESGNVITLSDVAGSGGGSVIDNIDDADASPSNELQNLSISGNNLSISSGNSVTLPSSSSDWTQNGYNIYYNIGKVGIGTSSPNRLLHLKQEVTNKAIRMEHQSTTDYWENGIGTTTKNYKFYFNGGSTLADISSIDGSFVAYSDLRLKRNIEYMGPVLSKIVQLKPATYNFKHNDLDAPRSTGFIAQEVEELFPDLVRETDDGYKGLVYDGFAVISIKAIQELNEKLLQMQTEIDYLKQAITDK